MPGIRLLDQKPQYTLAAGTLAAGGTIHFFISGTTTPKDVFGEPALSTNLGSVIDLESDGRTEDDIHLADDAAYRVDVRDADGASIPGYPVDNVGGAASAGADIPAPEDGNDGDVWSTDGTPNGGYWRAVRELADGTGHEDEVWHSDGTETGGYYAPLPTPEELPDFPADGVTQPSADVVTIGTIMMQKGTGTAPTAGSNTTSVAVVFPTAFGAGDVHVQVTPTIGPVTAAGAHANSAALSANATGFTASFFAGDEHGSLGTDISFPVTFSYFAWGPAP